MQHYKIKITGSGTKEEIIRSLAMIANSIIDEPSNYEDATLCMDIEECEPFDETL